MLNLIWSTVVEVKIYINSNTANHSGKSRCKIMEFHSIPKQPNLPESATLTQAPYQTQIDSPNNDQTYQTRTLGLKSLPQVATYYTFLAHLILPNPLLGSDSYLNPCWLTLRYKRRYFGGNPLTLIIMYISYYYNISQFQFQTLSIVARNSSL